MANVVETIERNGTNVLIYDSGMERNADTGRIIRPATNTLITSENATEYHRARQEQKRATIQAAANAAVERNDYRTTYGDMAFVAALAETAYIKATTPDDPKAIDAARFLLQETELSAARGPDAITPAAVVAGVAAGVAASMARLWDDVMQARSQPTQADVVEGQLREGENGAND